MGDYIKNYVKEIAGKTVIIQSCWLDPDMDIQANIGIGDGQRIDYCRVTITPESKILYLGSVILQMRQEYDAFLSENIGEILGFVKSLLMLKERMRLEGWR